MADIVKDYFSGLHSLVTPGDLEDAGFVLKVALFMLVARYLLTGSSNLWNPKGFPILTTFLKRKEIGRKGKEFKLAESIWYLCWHITSLILTLRVMKIEYGTPGDYKWLYYFIRDINGVWFFSEGSVHVASKLMTWPHITLTPETRFLMLLALGFWLSCCVYIHWETRRSDMRIMRFHHISTVVLIALNYKFRFHRLGMIIMLLHDIPDVLLFFTKCLGYIDGCKEVYKATSFICYGLSHFITRIVLMGRFIAYPIISNMDCVDAYGGPLAYICTLPGGVICLTLVVILTIMNIYWLNLIISMARAFARGMEIGDQREDSE